MKFICCFVVLLMLCDSLSGEVFVIGDIQDSNSFYRFMIRTAINTIYQENKVYIMCNDSLAYVSYANHKEVSFNYVSDNTYLKTKGNYNVYLIANRNEKNEIEKAFFVISKKNKKIARVSLIQL